MALSRVISGPRREEIPSSVNKNLCSRNDSDDFETVEANSNVNHLLMPFKGNQVRLPRSDVMEQKRSLNIICFVHDNDKYKKKEKVSQFYRDENLSGGQRGTHFRYPRLSEVPENIRITRVILPVADTPLSAASPFHLTEPSLLPFAIITSKYAR